MTTTTDLANVPHPAGATHVADWYDMQFGIDHVSRYFTGSSRVVERNDQARDVIVQIDGTQGADGDATRRILIFDGNTEVLQLSGDHARQLARALIAAADEIEQMANDDPK
jgi:hypothetical protein